MALEAKIFAIELKLDQIEDVLLTLRRKCQREQRQKPSVMEEERVKEGDTFKNGEVMENEAVVGCVVTSGRAEVEDTRKE
jgi:hypothetical protein